ncbi:MAG: LytTR family transcriptional regulator [Clostridia bacterium]|nr:LytTR family transcriptional regulator [Clostridia bacterium]
MKCTVNTGCDREEVIVYTKEKTPLTNEIERLCLTDALELIGYSGTKAVILSPSEILCFNVEGEWVYAHTLKGKYQIKYRLYQVENFLREGFVRINQSCIANIRGIERFDVSIGGSLGVVFKDGYRDYVSRRQTKHVKERLGIK